jgi:predicted alpha-1,2-mannosidase
MEGDPSPPSNAGIAAFGGTEFEMREAYASLLKAATEPTANDLSNAGCPVQCAGQRPSLDQWLAIHYISAVSNSWGGAGETLEDAIADFSLAQLARRLGDEPNERRLLERAQYWKNLFNPRHGYIQNRNADGTWPAFDPASDEGFAEGSSAQYTWMAPHNVKGLFALMGGPEKACERLDDFFHNEDGSWALTGSGAWKAEVDNEPSIGAPWLYLFCGKAYKTHEIIRKILTTLWKNAPDGIPGNDDLGAMSSWYVWSAMGLYPGIPGRAEMFLASPLYSRITINRPAKIIISAKGDGVFVEALTVNGAASLKSWLPEDFVAKGGSIQYRLSPNPDLNFARDETDTPPSFDK